ncbi:hypothetical protein BV20DRAFT_1049676 [Pilatotrama ljubarskyi]|nr:hypothetical protein BV20DRAFT_1049676 [Pilatotrama ljubarskyi]
MIVRPTAGESFNARRSQSTPPRRRSNSAGATTAPNSPALPSAAHLLVQALHTSSKHVPEPLLRSSSGKRKLFRLKRPSSSLVEKLAGTLREDNGVVHGTPPVSPSAPPRPPRHPGRVTARPSTSSGAPESSMSHATLRPGHTLTDSRELKASGDAADWEFPLPRGSEFPLQRKKSKTKCHTSRTLQDETAKNDLPFSTIDRAILEELRQKIRAREEQFVVRSGKKYHAFSPQEVPYPRSYDRQVVDLDVWDNLWQQQLGGSITMHVFETAPARVLELGCGTGTWILKAAREWKDSYFVGVDVVPLHPDLIQVGSFDLAARITWVQANFLERLPFPNEEFDYVRVVRVARGVPEDKWDGLFEEITRVMKPGGAFEMWEEDLRFPGTRRDTVPIIETLEPKLVSPPTPPHTDSSHSSEQERALPPVPYALPLHRSLAFSYSFDDVYRVKRSMMDETVRPLRAAPSNTNLASTPMLFRTIEKPPINPHDHSLLETIHDEMHAARFINLEPLALLANLLPLHLRDVRAPPPIVVNFPQAPAPASTPPLPFTIDKTVAAIGDTHLDDHKHQSHIASEMSLPGIIHGRDMASGTPFVALDTSRYSGFSPAALRRSVLLPGHSSSQLEHPHQSPAASSALGTHGRQDIVRSMNPLPNKTINFDPRSINLLLALRVQEVLACAEPMWDWVVDFQESVARSEKTITARRTPDHLTFKSSRRRHHPKQDALMDLTRQQFDELLRRFELDMKNRMYLGIAVEDRLGWAAYPPSASEEREEFEAMCNAWDEYERRMSSGSDARGRVSSPLAPLPRESNLERGTVYARAGRQAPSYPVGDADRSARRTSDPAQAGAATAPPSPRPGYAAPARLSEQEIPPSSRTGRIFVAWKA